LESERPNSLTYEPVTPQRRRRIKDIEVEWFADGGVTIRAPVLPRGSVGCAAASAGFCMAWVLFVFGGFRLVRFDRLALPMWLLLILGAFTALGAVAGGLYLWRSLRWERRSLRPEVVGISPTSVFADIPGGRSGPLGGPDTANEPKEAFEVPRSALRNVRLEYYPGGAGWARCVRLIIEGREPVDFCVGRREQELCDLLEVLQRSMKETEARLAQG
jgi:hypothetical protein